MLKRKYIRYELIQHSFQDSLMNRKFKRAAFIWNIFFYIMKVCNVVYFMSLCLIKVLKVPFQKQNKATQPKLLNAIVYLKLQVVTMKKYDLAIVLKCICFLVYTHLDWAAQIQSEKPQLRGCILTLCGCPLLPEASCPTPPDRLASSGRWPARKLLQKTTYSISTEAEEISLPRAFEIC